MSLNSGSVLWTTAAPPRWGQNDEAALFRQYFAYKGNGDLPFIQFFLPSRHIPLLHVSVSRRISLWNYHVIDIAYNPVDSYGEPPSTKLSWQGCT